MAIAKAVADARDAEIHEDEIGRGIDELGAIRRDVVVLMTAVSACYPSRAPPFYCAYLLLHTSSGSRSEVSRGHPGTPDRAIGRGETSLSCWNRRSGRHEALIAKQVCVSVGILWSPDVSEVVCCLGA